MLEVIDLVNRIARAIGYLVIGALVGWLIVATVEDISRALYRRRQRRKQWGDDEP